MDHSLSPSSMPQKSLCSSEESGWTSYLQDFSDASLFSLGGSSLLSDAASSAAWKFSHPHHLPPKLTFKKTRTKQISQDDPLEDTASSPVNSPKVADLHPTETSSRKVDDRTDDVAASMVNQEFDLLMTCPSSSTAKGSSILKQSHVAYDDDCAGQGIQRSRTFFRIGDR